MDEEEDDEDDRRHYILIRNLSRLLSCSVNHIGQMYPCPYCLYRFSTNDGLTKRIPECDVHGVQHASYPFAGLNDILQIIKLVIK